MSFYEDGDGVFGTNTVTISNETFHVNDFNYSKGSDPQVDTDGNGVPERQRLTATVGEGSMTLQFQGNDSTPPSQFDEFTYAGENLVVSEVGKQFTMGQYRRVNINIRERIT